MNVDTITYSLLWLVALLCLIGIMSIRILYIDRRYCKLARKLERTITITDKEYGSEGDEDVERDYIKILSQMKSECLNSRRAIIVDILSIGGIAYIGISNPTNFSILMSLLLCMVPGYVLVHHWKNIRSSSIRRGIL